MKLWIGIFITFILMGITVVGIVSNTAMFILCPFVLWTPVAWFCGAAWAEVRPMDRFIEQQAVKRQLGGFHQEIKKERSI